MSRDKHTWHDTCLLVIYCTKDMNYKCMAIKMDGVVRGMNETPRQKRKDIVQGLDNVVL